MFACRTNFLRTGTMAKGAAESGAVESYMCRKIARNPVVQARCAAYLGEFQADEAANGIQKDSQWLVSCAGTLKLIKVVCSSTCMCA